MTVHLQHYGIRHEKEFTGSYIVQRFLYWQIELQPGKNATETFIAPAEPGEYQIVCGAASHMEDGMVAKLVVTK